MCPKIVISTGTMFVVTILVLVSVVGANVNSTSELSDSKTSRMAWMKGLLDHHEWLELLGNVTVPSECEADLRRYVTALNKGQLWASKSKYF